MQIAHYKCSNRLKTKRLPPRGWGQQPRLIRFVEIGEEKIRVSESG